MLGDGRTWGKSMNDKNHKVTGNIKLFFTMSDEIAEALQMQSSFHHVVIFSYEGTTIQNQTQSNSLHGV